MPRALLLFACFCVLFIACANAWKSNLIRQESAVEKLIREGHHATAKRVRQQARKNYQQHRGQRLANAKEPITYYGDYEYIIQIGVGTPVQTFNVYLNLQSGDFWLPHTSCESLPGNCDDDCSGSCHSFGCMGCCGKKELPCDGKHKFDNTSSSTYKQANNPEHWNPNFGDTPVRGYYAQDTVTVSSGFGSIEIPNTYLELATFSDLAIGDSADGSLGLGFHATSTDQSKSTVLENAIKQGLLDKPVFSIWLDKGAQVGSVGGQITFGELDNEHCQNDQISYVHLSGKTYWESRLDTLLLNSKPFNGEKRAVNALFDINDPGIQITYTVMNDLVKQLNATYDFNHGGYTVDCSAKFTWGFSAGDKKFELDSKVLLTKTTDDGLCKFPFEEQWDWQSDVSIGVPFLHQWCSVYDLKNAQIGLAPLKQ